MPVRWDPKEHVSLGWYVVRWFVIVAPVSAAIGSVTAFFLTLLEATTKPRWAHPSLVWFLPLAGIAITASTSRNASSVAKGTHSVLEGGDMLREARLALPYLVAWFCRHIAKLCPEAWRLRLQPRFIPLAETFCVKSDKSKEIRWRIAR